MNTINDVLCFLNEIDFTDRINNDHHEKLRDVRLFIESEDYKVPALIYVLNIMDKINVFL